MKYGGNKKESHILKHDKVSFQQLPNTKNSPSQVVYADNAENQDA